jgi:hypothetical protein
LYLLEKNTYANPVFDKNTGRSVCYNKEMCYGDKGFY